MTTLDDEKRKLRRGDRIAMVVIGVLATLMLAIVILSTRAMFDGTL